MKIQRDRRKPVTETQMVSLADIAFLIIFFFMLSSSFMRGTPVDVKLPTLPKAARTDSQITVTLDDKAVIYLDERTVGSPAELEGLLKDKLAGKTDAKDCEVRFKCDRNQTRKAYHPIYEAIANAGGVIAVMHEEPR